MMSSCHLSLAKKKLNDALGDDFKKYLQNMKLWFRQKITKEQFDAEACRTLSPEAIRLHNEFFLAILDKCQSLCAPPSQKTSSTTSSSHANDDKLKKSAKLKKKPRPSKPAYDQRFQSADSIKYIPLTIPPNEVPPSAGFCSRDALLPDLPMIHGRMILTSWDCGLDAVSGDSVKLMVESVHIFIKALLLRILSHRKAYKLRDGKFPYAVGTPAINIYLNNASKYFSALDEVESVGVSAVNPNGDLVPQPPPTFDWLEGQSAFEHALSADKALMPISPSDLHSALKVHCGIIPSHTVYSINMERIVAKIHHPGQDEENLP